MSGTDQRVIVSLSVSWSICAEQVRVNLRVSITLTVHSPRATGFDHMVYYHKVNRVLRWFYIQHTFSPSICVHCDTGSGVISQSSELAASSSIFINVDFPVAEIICHRLFLQSVRSSPIFPSMLILTGVLRGLFVKAIWSIVTYLNTYHLLSVLLHLYSTESLSPTFSYFWSKKMKKREIKLKLELFFELKIKKDSLGGNLYFGVLGFFLANIFFWRATQIIIVVSDRYRWSRVMASKVFWLIPFNKFGLRDWTGLSTVRGPWRKKLKKIARLFEGSSVQNGLTWLDNLKIFHFIDIQQNSFNSKEIA